MNQLIRKGSNQPAKIRVELFNTGFFSYQSEIYGKVIICERILRPASTTLHLLNEK